MPLPTSSRRLLPAIRLALIALAASFTALASGAAQPEITYPMNDDNKPLSEANRKHNAKLAEPIVTADQVFAEVDGILAIEAEHFYKQTATNPRQWYITTANSFPLGMRDPDPSHAEQASGGTYVEALPDTRQNHGEKLIDGENFSDTPGEMATLHYQVHFTQPGRYYIWIRAYSSNSEDDSVHVGLDGEWPVTAARWRTTINDQWGWQRNRRFLTHAEEGGVPLLAYLDVKQTGRRDLRISMREDGAELDKIVLALDESYVPTGFGPEPTTRAK